MRLPGLLAEIEAATDTDAALAVAKAKGGTRAYFPANPDANHWLTQCVGAEKAMLIAQTLKTGHGGVELIVPMGPNVNTLARWRKIRQMIEEGCSKSVIALTCGVHERTVQNHKNGKSKTVDNLIKQKDLFD